MAEEQQQETQETPETESTTGYTPGPNAVDITPEKDGGVLKEIKQEGTSPDCPKKGNKVFVHYVGTLTDGTKFDSSRDRGDLFEFQLGKGQVIKAWDLGVATMKQGEVAVLTCQAAYAYGENGSPPKIPPNATLIFEVELFHWKGEDLSPSKDNGILRTQLEEGEGFKNPSEEASCEVHIIGRHDNKVFEDRDVKFSIGEGADQGIVDGVEMALKKFKAGEKSVLAIKSEYAYGAEGNKEYGIPPNADLEYEVTLKTFEKAKESWEMDLAEKLEQSEIMKQKGTDFFKLGKFSQALRYYKKIIDYLEKEEPSEEADVTKCKTLKLAAFLNSAMCQLKLSQNAEAKETCDKAIELDPTSEKGYFRRGTANMNIYDYEEAQTDFKKVLEIDPNNKAAKNQITISKAKIQQIKDKEKKTYAGMFQKFAEIDAKKENEKPKLEEQVTVTENNGSMDTAEATEDTEPKISSEEGAGENASVEAAS